MIDKPPSGYVGKKNFLTLLINNNAMTNKGNALKYHGCATKNSIRHTTPSPNTPVNHPYAFPLHRPKVEIILTIRNGPNMILESINEFGKTHQHAKATHTDKQVIATRVCALAAIITHIGKRFPLIYFSGDLCILSLYTQVHTHPVT